MFTLKIETDGASFRAHDTANAPATRTEHLDVACNELAELLEAAAKQVRAGWRGRPVIDSNGNKIGEWDFSTIDGEIDAEMEEDA